MLQPGLQDHFKSYANMAASMPVPAVSGAAAGAMPSADFLAEELAGLNIRTRTDTERRAALGVYHKRHVIPHLNQLHVVLIDTAAELAMLVEESRQQTCVAVDLEGVNLGMDGEIVLVQLAFHRRGPVYLVDCFRLGPEVAFSRASLSLTHILEAPSLEKLFFDLRSDFAALYHCHGVLPHPVQDLQLHDVLDRLLHGRNTERVSGFGFIIDKTRHAHLSKQERASVPDVKTKAHSLFAPDHGGSWEVWKQRPLPQLLLEYCTDARFLFALKESYGGWKGGRFSDVFGPVLLAATERRVAFSKSKDFARLKADRDVMVGVDQELLKQARAVWEAWKKENPGR